jgi:hypothetical protein
MFECVIIFLGSKIFSVRKNVSTPAIYIFEYLKVEILLLFYCQLSEGTLF